MATKKGNAKASGVVARKPAAHKRMAGRVLSVKDLPSAKLQSLARDFKPAVIAVTEKVGPMDAVKVMLAAIQEALEKNPSPKTNLAVAIGRGLLAREELKAQEGGSVSAEEARLELGGLSKEAALKRYRKGQLLGWREAKQGAVRFPVWQFEGGDVLKGIPDALAALNEARWMDDWGRILFFLSPRRSLDRKRPLDLLRKGESKRVIELAKAEIE